MMSSTFCHSLIKSWIIGTGDLLTEHVLKCFIYGDKGRDGTIVLRLLSVTFFKHWRPLSHFPRARPFPQQESWKTFLDGAQVWMQDAGDLSVSFDLLGFLSAEHHLFFEISSRLLLDGLPLTLGAVLMCTDLR